MIGSLGSSCTSPARPGSSRGAPALPAGLAPRLLVVAAVALLAGACTMTSSLQAGGRGGSSSSSGAGGDSQARMTMPDLFRMKKDDAVAALRRAGFRGDITWDDQLCGSVVDGHIIELGQVCRQHPAAGQPHSVRVPVKLLVQPEDPRHGRIGQNIEWHLMPVVVGLKVADALAAMRAAGFTDARTRVDYRVEPGCKPGVVCRSYPEGMMRAGQHSDRVLIAGADPAATPPPAARPATPPPATPPPATPPPAEDKPGSFF